MLSKLVPHLKRKDILFNAKGEAICFGSKPPCHRQAKHLNNEIEPNGALAFGKGEGVKICYIERYRWDKHRQCWQLVAVFDLPIGKPYRANSVNGKPKTAKPYAVNGNHDWDTYMEIARKFEHKAQYEDRQDLLHTIIVNLAVVGSNNGLPDKLSWAYRIASFTVAQYWRDYYKHRQGIDCGHCSNPQRKKCKAENLYPDCPKAITELGELIADDKAIDLDTWLDDKTWLLGCKRRLIEIAYKMVNGIALDNADKLYLSKWRRKEQKRLL